MKRTAIDEALRQAVRKCGRTPYSVGTAAGLESDIVGRFLRGRDIRISTAAKIADVLGLELVKRK